MDIYKNFEELNSVERAGVDFEISCKEKDSQYAVIAIHGGEIERGTTEIAKEIAGSDWSFYSFVGKAKTNRKRLHITSVRFDEPTCVNLVHKSTKILSIHGKKEEEEFVMVGGLDEALVAEIKDTLRDHNFEIREPSAHVRGIRADNICNKGRTGKGVQLEISRGLRDVLLRDQNCLLEFKGAIREACKRLSAD